MGRTKFKKRGSSLEDMTDKERRFCLEYPVDYNGKRAVIDAGYSSKNAAQTAVKLLKKPHIAAAIGKAELITSQKLELSREEVLKQLYYLATRDGKDFVDENGRIFQNIKDLPDRASAAIDGIKQKVRTYRDAEGEEVTEVETELKLTSKVSAIDMAMKHKGLFAPTESKTDIAVHLDGLLGELARRVEEGRNVVDTAFIEAKSKALPNKEQT